MSSSNSLSAAFKGTSREKKAHWGNRFVRDHNDLLYEANPESISNRIKSNAKKTNNIRVNKQDLPPAESQFTVFKPRGIHVLTQQHSQATQPAISVTSSVKVKDSS